MGLIWGSGRGGVLPRGDLTEGAWMQWGAGRSWREEKVEALETERGRARLGLAGEPAALGNGWPLRAGEGPQGPSDRRGGGESCHPSLPSPGACAVAPVCFHRASSKLGTTDLSHSLVPLSASPLRVSSVLGTRWCLMRACCTRRHRPTASH